MAHEQVLTNRTAHETSVSINDALSFKGQSLDAENIHDLKERTAIHFAQLSEKTPSASANMSQDYRGPAL